MTMLQNSILYWIVPFLLFGGFLFFFVPTSKNVSLRQLANHCGSAAIPFWSRGFARSCCDIFPTHFGRHSGGFFEAGIASDPTYFIKKHIKSGSVIYIVTSDFPKFLDVFYNLDKAVRITLVTGSEDIGAPWEIFHPDRDNFFDYKMKSLWPKGQVMSMREFVRDERLLHWYAQNYDFIGNNSFTKSDIDPVKDRALTDKVHPLPIGLDFHSLAEKNHKLTSTMITGSICDQRTEVSNTVVKASPFLERELSAYAQFDCIFPSAKSRHMRLLTRGEVCKLLVSNSEKSDYVRNKQIIFTSPYLVREKEVAKISNHEAKSLFWKQLSKVQFALAPPGFGMDTHRAWEILSLHTVPIVLTSPLDELYKMFPVIIVKGWSEVFAEGSLSRFQLEITNRFGNIPFTEKVDEMLRASFWVDRIRNSSST